MQNYKYIQKIYICQIIEYSIYRLKDKYVKIMIFSILILIIIVIFIICIFTDYIVRLGSH